MSGLSGDQWSPEGIPPASAEAGTTAEFSVEDHFLLEIRAHRYSYNFVRDKSNRTKSSEGESCCCVLEVPDDDDGVGEGWVHAEAAVPELTIFQGKREEGLFILLGVPVFSSSP